VKDLIKKDKELEDAFESINTLNQRITYMVASKLLRALNQYQENRTQQAFNQLKKSIFMKK